MHQSFQTKRRIHRQLNTPNGPTTTRLHHYAGHYSIPTPTGTKLSPQHPLQGATGTKLSQQHPQSTKTGHFSPARRIISRSQHRTTEQGEFSPATTPLNTHHRDTTTPTGTKPTQQRRRQRAQPGARVSTRDKTLPARPSNRSRAKKLAQQQPNLGQTAKKLSQRAQKHQNLAIFPEQGELFRVSRTNSPRRANFFAFPTPHHRAGRIFSRNNTAPPSRENFLPQQHHPTPITGTPPPQPVQNSPSNSLTLAKPRKNSPNAPPTTPQPGARVSTRERVRPAPPPTVPARKNSPSNSPILAKPRKNSPNAPKNTKI